MIWLFLLALWVDISDTHWKVVVIFQEFLLFDTSFFPDFYLSLEKMGHKNVTKHINWQFFLWVDVLGTHWKVVVIFQDFFLFETIKEGWGTFFLCKLSTINKSRPVSNQLCFQVAKCNLSVGTQNINPQKKLPIDLFSYIFMTHFF